MKTKHFVVCLLWQAWLSMSFVQGQKPISAWIISQETNNLSAHFTMTLKYIAHENIVFKENPIFHLGIAGTVENYQNLSEVSLLEGDSIVTIVQIAYDTTSLPFYPRTFEVSQSYQTVDGEPRTVSVYGSIYFTPYRTVEVLSAGDFSNSLRIWFHSYSQIDTVRRYVSRDSIPVSNLDETDAIDTTWKENWTFKEVHGLAYRIPMKAMHPDSIATHSAQGDGFEEHHVRSMYSGTVSGRLVMNYLNDLGNTVIVPLAGLRVELDEKDFYPFSNQYYYETFRTGYTDEQGFFSLPYNFPQAGEGGEVELFLNVKAKTKDDGPVTYKIKGKQNNLWHNVHFQHIDLGAHGDNFVQNVGDIPIDREEFRTVHWARRYEQYIQAHNGNTGRVHKLAILTHVASQSRFFPDGILGGSNPLLDPTIRISEGDGVSEATIRHEFGHFLMWELQDRNFIIPIQNTCGHSWDNENTPQTAWIEGFADAFSMIIDAAYWQEDGEYAKHSFKSACIYELRMTMDIKDPGLPFVQNGLHAEYFFATSLYDLWDGPNKGLPATIPQYSGEDTELHGYNDKIISGALPSSCAAWVGTDNVEYSFEDLISPIKGKPLMENIPEYMQRFLSEVVGSDCEKRAEISKLLQENRLLYHIDLYEAGIDNNGIGTDIISFSLHYSGTAEICSTLVSVPIEMDYRLNYFANTATPNLNIPITTAQIEPIIDDLWLGNATNTNFPIKHCQLFINGDPNVTTLPTGTLETCAGADIELNNAHLILGHNSGLSATLIFNAGSTFKISSSGSLFLFDNSKIVIEQGAKLIIEQGASILLLGNNSILEIRGTLDLKDKAIFTFTGAGFVRFANGNTIIAANNSQIKFTGSSPSYKVVEIADNAFISNYNLVKTTLQSGRCELGQNAFWDTGNGQVLFTDAVFTALDNTKPYQTIYTNGQDPTIQDCQFSYGQTGLTARNFMSLGASITLTNVEIHHCNIALRDYDKGAHLENVHFHHNNIGWKAEYQAFNSQLLNSEIADNINEGVSFTGNTNLAVESPNIHHNLYGLDFIGAGNLVPVCGGVIFNGSTGIGGYQNAKIQLSGNPLSSPKVNLSYNTTSSVFLWGARVYLNEGRNNLSPEQGGMALAVITPQTNSLNAKHNHWNENSIPYGTSPVFGTDYNLYSIGSANPVNVIDNQPIEYQSCNGIIQRQMYIPECVECEVIKTPHFDYVRIDSALRQVAEDLYEYSRFQHVAANYGLLTEILEFAYTKSDITQDEVLNTALDMAKYTFAEGIATATISYNATGEIGQPAAKIFQLIDSRITNTLDTPSVFYRKIDKAILYNLLQRPALALTVLNAITTEIAEQAEYQDYWTCFVELRRDMQLQTIESAEITQRLAACPAISRPSQGANKMESSQIAASLSLFPNPSQGEARISLFSPEENTASLTVYDIQGRKVQEIALFACQKGTNMLSLSATSLTNGMYSVVIQLGNEVLSQKWLVQK